MTNCLTIQANIPPEHVSLIVNGTAEAIGNSKVSVCIEGMSL
jgi:hypothetical protein